VPSVSIQLRQAKPPGHFNPALRSAATVPTDGGHPARNPL
jgi:hypothetical protein